MTTSSALCFGFIFVFNICALSELRLLIEKYIIILEHFFFFGHFDHSINFHIIYLEVGLRRCRKVFSRTSRCFKPTKKVYQKYYIFIHYKKVLWDIKGIICLKKEKRISLWGFISLIWFSGPNSLLNVKIDNAHCITRISQSGHSEASSARPIIASNFIHSRKAESSDFRGRKGEETR